MDPLLFPLQPPPPPTTAGATSTTTLFTTSTTTEPLPSNHTPLSAPQPSSYSHPPYDDMIIAAITALKETEGSSKRAIGKYIETTYPNLPLNHSDSLAFHLKRLKATGLLVMNKKSYMLSRSDNSDFVQTNHNNNNTYAANVVPTSTTTAASVAGSDGVVVGSGGVKRGRGRPPKPKVAGGGGVNGLPGDVSGVGSGVVLGDSSGLPVVEGGGATGAQPLLASLGLTEELPQLGKRTRGRPKRFVPGAGQGGAVAAGGVKKGRGRPKGVKKGVGRPKKLKTVAGVKRGPGRPAKASQVNSGVAEHDGASGAAPPGAAGFGNSPKPRGRPKKNVENGNIGVVSVKQAGGQKPGITVKSTRKPVGRPKKNAGGPQQAESYGDLKRKLEFFQSKVMEAVGVLKPQVSSQAPVTVIAAIQELEGLAALDLNAPFGEDPQLPLPQPQQLPQPLQLPQHFFPPQSQLMAQLQLPQPQLMPQQQLPQAHPFLH